MPFDVPYTSPSGGGPSFGGAVGGILLGGLNTLVQSGVGALTSGFMRQEGEADIMTGTIGGPPMVQAGSCGNCGPDPCKLPDYLYRGGEAISPDPCFPRPSQRTITESTGCKVVVPVWAPKRRKPRMNPLNPRALSRSLRRVSGFARAAKRSRTSINKAARAIK